MPLLLAFLLFAQDYSQRGFVESGVTLYPQTAENDSGHAVGDARVRYEGFYKPWQALLIAGALDVRTDTHHQTERQWRFDWLDRSVQRPLLSLRRFSMQYHRGGLTIEAGKQFVRWGKTDIVNPTDRFAPRDFLTVVDNEFLGITAIRATYERGSNTVDAIWSPRLTPGRIPLVNQRWSPIQAPVSLPPILRTVPNDDQAGVRWSHVGVVEFSAAYYSGFHNVPTFEPRPDLSALDQFYPKLRMVGGDVVVPLKWLSAKMETGYFRSSDDRVDDYVQYVIQLERQSGEWFFVGGYGGEIVTQHGSLRGTFNPERGLIRTMLARTSYTIDANRSVAVETAVRQDGDGLLVKGEYSQAFGQHWRLTTGFSLIRGKPEDFLGQYRRNSHGLIAVKYSF